MRSLLILLALVAFATAQSPIPIPGLQLSFFDGMWYVPWEYNSQFPSPNNPISCITMDITTSSTGGSLAQTVVLNGRDFNQTTSFTAGSSASVWNINGTQVDWVAFDLISHSWGVMGLDGVQEAIVFSKNPQISNAILNANILLLQKEGYMINATNQWSFPSENC